MLKQKYFLTGIFILSAERQPIKLAWRKIVWLLELNCFLLSLPRRIHLKNNNMDVEIKEKENRRHVGRNLQRIRVYLGMKQEALAADLGVNQQIISKIEKQEEIEEGFLKRIAEVLGISEEVIKDFDVEKTIFNINHHNYKDANISEGATTYAIVQQINPLEKIVELYERLLKSEQDKIEILKKYMK